MAGGWDGCGWDVLYIPWVPSPKPMADYLGRALYGRLPGFLGGQDLYFSWFLGAHGILNMIK